MENHFADQQTMILSMDISCCKGCPKILKKKLLKMPGVESVAIDTEKDLVFVKGTINPTALLNNVAKLGKSVKLLPTDDQNYNRNRCRDDGFTARNKGKMHQNCCCEDGRHNHKKKVEEEEHTCETYVLPNVDERVCRDFYCAAHQPLHKIVDNVPAEKSFPFGFGGLPFHGGYGPYGGGYGGDYGGGSYLYPGRYAEEPPSQLGYGPPWRVHPQHPYGFQ